MLRQALRVQVNISVYTFKLAMVVTQARKRHDTQDVRGAAVDCATRPRPRSYSNIFSAYASLASAAPRIVEFFRRTPFINDEPKLFQYVATVNSKLVKQNTYAQEVYGTGTSFDERNARLRALGEAIERYSLAAYKTLHLVYADRQTLHNALDPGTVVNFSSVQLKNPRFRRCRVAANSRFNWIKAKTVTGKELFVPAQLIFVPYIFARSEPRLRFSISTGAATGTTLTEALFRGICEVIERDSFMIYYLNKIPVTEIKTLHGTDDLREVTAYLARYKLETRIFNLTTDVEVPVFLCVLIDRTGVGPAVSVGAKAGFHAQRTILGAIEEAMHSRLWVRAEMYRLAKVGFLIPPDSSDVLSRSLLWSKTEMIDKLSFWLNTPKVINADELPSNPDELTWLTRSVKAIHALGYEIFYVDLTPEEIANDGIFVVKALIPDLHPLYLDEKYKYLGGARLVDVPLKLGLGNSSHTLNKVPHPFA